MIAAHIRKSPPTHEPLFGTELSHLERTAAFASRFAAEMIPPDNPGLAIFARETANLLGLWHDLGKCSEKFQNYLLQVANPDPHALETRSRDRVDHSTAGAQHAVETIRIAGTLLAFAIAGHHTGLPDWNGTGESVLKARLQKRVEPWRSQAAPELLKPTVSLPSPSVQGDGFSWAFLVRMLYSCLTDADFLATEAFMDPDRSASREVGLPSLVALAECLETHLRQRFPVTSRTEGDDSALAATNGRSAAQAVQFCRQQVLAECLQAATMDPGFFSLNVPTGGGKTLSGMAFALTHAAQRGLRRVICAIPFTSIIEQNAGVYRRVFAPLGDGIVLEHHANLDPDEATSNATRLAAENWDAPIVVTTNVQFFESLLASRSGRCRKLHRLARSVILLDEAQCLPVELLHPSLEILRELVKRYGCTVVLATATQPALEYRDDFKIGLTGIRHIIADPHRLSVALRRVTVEDAGILTLEATAARLAGESQGLVIVNSRRHALALYSELKRQTGGDGCHHLSALMCPRHRSERLAVIKERLQAGMSCRVVATSLVEAGVDLDFPLVLRAMAGLDAIAQAAGRCNREGRLPQPGLTLVFTPEEATWRPQRGDLAQAAAHAREVIAGIMAQPESRRDLLSQEAIRDYFRLHYWNQGGDGGRGWDRAEVMDCFKLGKTVKEPFLFQFKEAAARFRFIDNTELPVIIPWDDKASDAIRILQSIADPDPKLVSRLSRTLQRYVVTIPERQRQMLLGTLGAEILHERFCILLNQKLHYSGETGLLIPGDPTCDPGRLIV
ncbi:MAG: CRISPR-associated endonuclease Cas3'' [Magnetococcales bacterium]|nr:CRISPR-associated endonuclease Cas3'' [Magnetococcales bacterium]